MLEATKPFLRKWTLSKSTWRHHLKVFCGPLASLSAFWWATNCESTGDWYGDLWHSFTPECLASWEIACPWEVSMPFLSILATTPLESFFKIRLTQDFTVYKFYYQPRVKKQAAWTQVMQWASLRHPEIPKTLGLLSFCCVPLGPYWLWGWTFHLVEFIINVP